jgi:hypothetical protein
VKPAIKILRPDLWKPKGLGDVVAAVALPVAKAIDAVAGTQVAQCGGCKRRQEALNAAVPFGASKVDTPNPAP